MKSMTTIRGSIIYPLCLFLFYSSIYAQNDILDSLEHKLALHPEEDTIRVELLNTLAHHYRRHDITIAEQKCKEAHQLATAINDKKGLAKNTLILSKIHLSKSEFNEAKKIALLSLEQYKKIGRNNAKGLIAAYNTLGMLANYQNASDTAVIYFTEAMHIAEKSNQLRSQGDMLNNIGVTYYSKGELDDALTYFKKSIQVDEQLGDDKRKATCFNNIAIIYSIQGRYSEALELYNEILDQYKKGNKRSKIASTCQNIGIVYSEMEQHQKALEYFEKAYEIYNELEDKLNSAKVLNSIGNALVELKNYDKGIKILNQALQLNQEVQNNEALIASHNTIGKVRIWLNQPLLALEHFEASLALSEAANDRRNIGLSQINLGDIHLILKNYDASLEHALKGKEIVDDLEMLAEQVLVNEILSKVYEQQGDLKNAVTHFKQFKILNDSLFNKENIQKITQLEYEYKYKNQLEKAKNKEIKLTETVKTTTSDLKKTQHNLLLGIIIFLSVTIILGMIIFYLRVRNVKSETQNIITEQRLLRSQMTPHFIFNALSVLQGIILNQENKKAVSYLSKFSKLLRVTLENSREQMVSLNQELIAIENYINLQNIEVDIPYNYSITVDSKIDKERFYIPPMLLQPFIENTIEHGFVNHNGEKEITIALNYTDKALTCTIKDNGIGIDAQKNSSNQNKKSLSTAITTERLEFLSRNTKHKGSIRIEDRKKYDEQGTLVTLNIPYKIDVNQ
jgi:tetratricopeptide (TPR) repeat protein